MITNQCYAMLHFDMYIPENNRKTFGSLFSEIYIENIVLKWVSLFIYELLESKKKILYIVFIFLKLF